MNNFLKTKINTRKVSIVIVVLIILCVIFSNFPIIPKFYSLIYNYEFSYGNSESGNQVNNIKWENDNLIIEGDYTWMAVSTNVLSDLFPTYILGFYKVKDNNIHLYISDGGTQFHFLRLIKKANALGGTTGLIYDKSTYFKFTIKNLPKQDYGIVLNNVGQWKISTENKKTILQQESCDEISNLIIATGCLISAAREFNDPELCLKLDNFKGTDNSRYIDDCIINSIDKIEHLKYCDLIKDDYNKDYCFNKLAEKFLDKEVCKKIEDSSKETDCWIEVTRALKYKKQ